MKDLLVFSEQDGGVVPAKSKIVVEREAHVHFACFVGDVVEIAFRIGRHVVHRGRDDAVQNGFDADDRFEAARRAEHVARHGFRAADGDLPGLFAEDHFEGSCFGCVI